LDDQGVRRGLVVVALPGVQKPIAEARSTSDVSAASAIYSALAQRASAASIQPWTGQDGRSKLQGASHRVLPGPVRGQPAGSRVAQTS
jgi:CRISPR-associated protein